VPLSVDAERVHENIDQHIVIDWLFEKIDCSSEVEGAVRR
jgi:hypothetical protein